MSQNATPPLVPTPEDFTRPGTPAPGINPAIALQILPPAPDHAQWLAMRRTGIGGSDVSALLGLSRYRSPYDLWEDKTGRAPLVETTSEVMEMGNLLEPVVRDRFARVHDLTVRAAGTLRSVEWPWMLANPDGLVSDGHGYEGKTCSLWAAHEWGTDQDPLVPDHAELQAQWCMAVTGYTAWHVACLVGGQHNVYRIVRRDDALIADLVTISYRFWHHNVLDDTPPPVDGSEATTRLLDERYPTSTPGSTVEITTDERDALLVAREKAAAAEQAAKTDHDKIRNTIKDILGDAERLTCDGRPVATWKTTSRFAARAFAKAHPELHRQYQVQTTTLDVQRLAADHPELHRQFCSRELRFATA